MTPRIHIFGGTEALLVNQIHPIFDKAFGIGDWHQVDWTPGSRSVPEPVNANATHAVILYEMASHSMTGKAAESAKATGKPYVLLSRKLAVALDQLKRAGFLTRPEDRGSTVPINPAAYVVRKKKATTWEEKPVEVVPAREPEAPPPPTPAESVQLQSASTVVPFIPLPPKDPVMTTKLSPEDAVYLIHSDVLRAFRDSKKTQALVAKEAKINSADLCQFLNKDGLNPKDGVFGMSQKRMEQLMACLNLNPEFYKEPFDVCTARRAEVCRAKIDHANAVRKERKGRKEKERGTEKKGKKKAIVVDSTKVFNIINPTFILDLNATAAKLSVGESLAVVYRGQTESGERIYERVA